jgi:hypothetical protein
VFLTSFFSVEGFCSCQLYFSPSNNFAAKEVNLILFCWWKAISQYPKLINWMRYWFQSYHDKSWPIPYVFKFWYAFRKYALEPRKVYNNRQRSASCNRLMADNAFVYNCQKQVDFANHSFRNFQLSILQNKTIIFSTAVASAYCFILSSLELYISI